MDRPSVYAKSVRAGIVSTIVTAVLLGATSFIHVTPSQAAQSSDDAGRRRSLGQYFMNVGQGQYDRGFYDQALKSCHMAQTYKDSLDPVEQRKLQSLQDKAAAATAERNRALAAKQAAEDSYRKGDPAAVRARLDGIKDSAFLTEKERLEIADMLRGTAPQRAGTAPVSPVSYPQGARPGASDTPGQRGNTVAEQYYESVKAYHTGDLKTARKGFTQVLDSGSLPAPMVETVRGYLADIDAAEAGRGNGQPAATVISAAALTNSSSASSAATDSNAPADVNTPAAANAASVPAAAVSPSEVERIAELYSRSYELYSQGELAAAREGFVEVAKTGLFKAPEGRRPEDYIATIDRLRATAEKVQRIPQPVTPISTAEPAVTPVTSVPPVGEPEQGSFVDVINRRRSVIRSHTEAVVNDAVDQAQKLVSQGQFAAAMDLIANARRTVGDNQVFLGEDLYKQHMQRLNDVADRVSQAQAAKDKRVGEQKRTEAAVAQRELRDQAEVDRQNRINELLERAQAYWKQQQYDAALGQLDALLALDPTNDQALTLKSQTEDMIYTRKQIELNGLSSKQRADILMGTDEAMVPYADDITYFKGWRKLIERSTRKPEEPFALDPANVQVYEQLDTMVNLSQLTPQTPASEAFDALRKSVEPPLNIVVVWRDLQENVLVDPSTPINIDGMPNVKLSTALESLLRALSDPGYPDNPVEYVVNSGVVQVATRLSLPPRKMEARVYDITDLVGQPANYGQMGMMMGMMGGGMMGGGMMGGGMGGGMMGGGMGGMGGMGGYGGGMGGMGGGMMGGGMMGGGMGGMGGGMMGGGMGGMGGMGGYGGGMGGMGGGMGGMMGGMGGMGGYGGGGTLAYSLRDLIMQSVNPNSWYDLSTQDPPPEGQIILFPTDMPKKMAVYNTAEAHKQITELLDQLRKALGHEVSIEARFLIVTENFLERIGLDVDFSYNTGGKWGVITVNQDSFLSGAPDTSTRVPGSLGGLGSNPAATVTAGYGSILDDLQVSVLVHATQGRTDAKALAAPKVTVLSGESASFSIQDMVAYALPPTTTTQAAVGGVGTGVQQQGSFNNISAVQIGSTLSISPTITKDKKYVLLNIVSQQIDLLRLRELQVEQTNPNTTAGAPPTVKVGVTVPETETSNVATRVSVPDRGTLLLGGHKLAAQVDKEVGVPVLSKIPLIGRLFSNRSSIRDQKVLLILVKPTIILQEEAEQDAIAAMEQVVAEPRP